MVGINKFGISAEILSCAHSPARKSRFSREREYKTENKASLPRSEEFIDHWLELTGLDWCARSPLVIGALPARGSVISRMPL